MTKVFATEYRVADSPEHREVSSNCVARIIKDIELGESKPELAGRLVFRSQPALFSFGPQDIADIEAFASQLRVPGADNGVSHYLREKLGAETIGMLQASSRVTPSLRVALASNLNAIVCSGKLLYESTRFAGVPLSAKTTELLQQKPIGLRLCVLNRLLLNDAFPKELEAMKPDQFVIAHELQAAYKSRAFITIDERLTEETKGAFGKSVEVVSYSYWIP